MYASPSAFTWCEDEGKRFARTTFSRPQSESKQSQKSPMSRYSMRLTSLMTGGESTMGRVRLKCEGMRRRVGGEMKGQRENGVGIQHASHYRGA
jgi:hypothetical protein